MQHLNKIDGLTATGWEEDVTYVVGSRVIFIYPVLQGARQPEGSLGLAPSYDRSHTCRLFASDTVYQLV